MAGKQHPFDSFDESLPIRSAMAKRQAAAAIARGDAAMKRSEEIEVRVEEALMLEGSAEHGLNEKTLVKPEGVL